MSWAISGPVRGTCTCGVPLRTRVDSRLAVTRASSSSSSSSSSDTLGAQPITSTTTDVERTDALQPHALLIDAMAMAYRAHHVMAKQNLTNQTGDVNTGLLHSFISSVLSLLEHTNATHLLLVFDAKGATFRHQMWPEYKANRPSFPDELAIALPRLKDLLGKLGWPLAEVPGVEADDVIGTAAVKLAAHWRETCLPEQYDVTIVSPDKDFFQLLSDDIQIVRPIQSRSVAKLRKEAEEEGRPQPNILGSTFHVYTMADFEAAYPGLKPRQFIDLLALSGDSSDNVPGVRNIGVKTAPAIVAAFGSAEEAVEACARGDVNVPDGVPKRAVKALLAEGAKEAVSVSKELVTIRTDLKIPPVRYGLHGSRCEIDEVTGDFNLITPSRVSSASGDDGSAAFVQSFQWPMPGENPEEARAAAIDALSDYSMTNAIKRWRAEYDLRAQNYV